MLAVECNLLNILHHIILIISYSRESYDKTQSYFLVFILFLKREDCAFCPRKTQIVNCFEGIVLKSFF